MNKKNKYLNKVYFVITYPALQKHLIPHLRSECFGLTNVIFYCNMSLMKIAIHDISATLEKENKMVLLLNNNKDNRYFNKFFSFITYRVLQKHFVLRI